MRVGTLCYATQSGLGILAKSFFDHGIISDILVVKHPHYQEHLDWYPEQHRYSRHNYVEFLKTIDVLLLLENAWYWDIVKVARSIGVRVVMIPMYEYTPFPLPVPADYYICPSLLDYDFYKHLRSSHLTIPVDVPWKLRTKATNFVHNAGHGGRKYRNGTPELLEAMQYVESPIKLTVRGQPGERRIKELFDLWRPSLDPRVTLTLDNVPETELYNGDVFIFPEKFNGLSLPLQEAHASGMLVMASYRYPMYHWLPVQPLIPVSGMVEDKQAVDFFSAVIDPHTIADTIDAWYGRDIEPFSLMGKEWASKNSWEVLKPQYLDLLEGKS